MVSPSLKKEGKPLKNIPKQKIESDLVYFIRLTDALEELENGSLKFLKVKGEARMAKGKDKTNVMRILDQHKIEYNAYTYETDGSLSGKDVAKLLQKEENTVFKTLVTEGKSKVHYVFVIPVHRELDLKKASEAVGEKNIAMVKSKELLGLTGYIHGGCSPIGMKKPFKTFFQKEIERLETLTFSAGKIGYQVEVKVSDLEKIIAYETADLIC